MIIHCPQCEAEIAAVDVNLTTGWGKCTACNEIFALADVLPNYRHAAPENTTAAPAVLERPFDAHAILERDRTKLMIHVPAYGMRAGTWAIAGFATFWLGFIAFWTAGALGVFFGGGQWPPDVESMLFAAFSTPFWIVGFGMLGSILWLARGTRTVYLDAFQMQLLRQCLFYRRTIAVDRARVQYAREADMFVKGDQPSSVPQIALEIVYEKGSFKLPCDSEDERRWLIFEINDFLKATPPSIEY